MSETFLTYPNSSVRIRDVQEIQIEMLAEFDRVCKRHDIPYQLFAGTLLGSVRHKGFIPWDDDIDVCMLRADYERFLNLSEEEVDSRYFVQTFRSDPGFHFQFAKMRKRGTRFLEHWHTDGSMESGVFIDIFPFDNVEPDRVSGRIQQFLLWALISGNLRRFRNICLKETSAARRVGSLTLHYGLKPIPARWINALIFRILNWFSDRNTVLCNHLSNGASPRRLRRYLRSRDAFTDCIEGEFEGQMFPIPRDYDEVLKQNFGDYMQLPAPEERMPHHRMVDIKLS
jgi:lipopolysaccharide cholinephosphotransferase